MAGLSVGELFARITADDTRFRRGLANADLRMRAFNRDVNSHLRDLNERFRNASRAMARALRDGITSAASAAGDALRRFSGNASDTLGRLGRWVTDRGAAMGRGIRDGISNGTRGAINALGNLWHSFSWNARIMSNNFAHQTRSMWRRFITGSGQAGDDSGRGLAGRMLSRIGSAIRSGIGTAMNTGLSGLQRVTSSVSSNPYVGAIGAAMVVGIISTLGPLLVAAIGGLVISVAGIGIIGLGAALLKDEPEIKKAATSLAETAKKTFKAAASPLKAPFKEALDDLKASVVALGPELQRAFAAAGPLVKPLTDGLTLFVENTLPGLIAALEDGQPVFEGLRDMLGKIGEGLSGMFEVLGQEAPSMGKALSDLGSLIKGVLIGLGYFITATAGIYGNIRMFVEMVVKAFAWMYDVLVGHSIIPDLVNAIIRWFAGLPGKAAAALAALPGNVFRLASHAASRMTGAIQRGVGDAVRWVQGLPGKAQAALGGLGGTLMSAGRSLVSGFIAGIRSQFGSVQATLSSLTSLLPDWKGPAAVDAKILTPAGRSLIEGFQRGISMQTPALRSQLGGLTGQLPGMAVGAVGGRAAGGGRGRTLRVVVEGPEAVKGLIRTIVLDDGGGDVQRAFGI